jgi:hypothetical protein
MDHYCVVREGVMAERTEERLHWFVPVSFVLGIIMTIAFGYSLYPAALPWNLAFWLGWLGGVFYSRMMRRVDASGTSQ